MAPVVQEQDTNAQLSPMALSILGLEQAGFLPSRDNRSARVAGRSHRPSERKVTSYYNHFSSRCAVSSDPPPSYINAVREARSFPPSPRHLDHGKEILPRYTCTVFKEGPMQMRLESCSPFLILPFQEWKPVYVILQGTQISIHKLKTLIVGKQQVSSPGRLYRSYTLQHAEVGMAPDITHRVMVPTCRLASLIPPIARKKANEKDPELFRVDRHWALRIRAETDQLVLTAPAEEQAMSWVNHVSAGIDIAPALDERAVPRQCTMPRRRRRQPRSVAQTDLFDPRFVEQQRRLLASFEGNAARNSLAGQPSPDMVPDEAREDLASQAEAEAAPAAAAAEQEQEDIDLAAIAEEDESSQRPTSAGEDASRSPSTAMLLSDNALANLDENGKWAPPHPRTVAQQWRYVRRIMPILLPETPRHSSVLIAQGRYVRPNYKTDALEPWSLQPPSYEIHNFAQLHRSALSQHPHRTSFSSGLTSQTTQSRTESSTDMQRVDSTAHADAIEIQGLTSDRFHIDFENFAVVEKDRKNHPVRVTSSEVQPLVVVSKREPSRLSTASAAPAQEASPGPFIFGF